MKDIKLTADGDLDFSSRDMEFVTGDDAIIQGVTIRLQFNLGELALDTRLGTPWIQRIFVKGVPESIVDGILREVIVGSPGIASLVSFRKTIDKEKRKTTITFQARKQDGEILDFNGVFVLPSTTNSVEEG